MQLTADQELRKELLLYALDKQREVEAAIAMAAQMERFVLKGLEGAPERPFLPDANADKAPGGEMAPSPAVAAAQPGRFGKGGMKRRWSDADDAKLKELWHTTANLEEIAEVLGRTIPSLYSRARALGMSKRASKLQELESSLRHTRGEDLNGSAACESGSPARSNGSSGKHAVPGDPAPADVNNRRTDVARERYHPKGRRLRQPQSARNGAVSAHTGLSAAKSSRSTDENLSIDPVIRFLRSRDYSVVRVGDGQFKLDGRRILSADELREKANQVRKTLGQPPFASQRAEPVS